jgi:single-stranded DNA-binding protein
LTDITFLTPKDKSGQSTTTQATQPKPQAKDPQQVAEPDENQDDDLPF